MKKVLIPWVILLLIAFIVTGCGNNTSTSITTSSTPPGSTTPVVQPSTTTPFSSTPVSSIPASTTPSAGNQKYGGTFTWILPTGPAGPIGYIPEVTGPSGVTPIICFECLIKEMLDGTLKPWLASSWDVDTSANSPSVTFHLQQGVKFSDGTDFNAAAVKWNLDNFKKTPYDAAATAKWDSLDVSFSEWDNTLVRSFSGSSFYLESPTAFEKNGIDWARYNMVGTGPFLQKEYQKDVVLSGTRNPNYWQAGKPFLDGVTWDFVADDMTAIALFKSGSADVVGTTNPTALKELAAAGNNVISFPLGPYSLVPDGANADSPWSNLLVREAAEYAIDKVAMANTFEYGLKAANQFSPPFSMAYDPSITGRNYDVAKAKQLMAEAGYPDGFKTTITAGPIHLNKDAVLAVQSYLAKIGIQAELEFPAMGAYSQMQTNPWHNGLRWMSINALPNPNYNFNYFLAAPPVIDKSVYEPDDYPALLNQSMTAPEPDPGLMKQIENMIYDNAMVIPIFYGANNTVFAPYVMDTGYGARGQSNWWEPQDTWLNK
jgi:peptide/nickel transport system substrate-binding protein